MNFKEAVEECDNLIPNPKVSKQNIYIISQWSHTLIYPTIRFPLKFSQSSTYCSVPNTLLRLQEDNLLTWHPWLVFTCLQYWNDVITFPQPKKPSCHEHENENESPQVLDYEIIYIWWRIRWIVWASTPPLQFSAIYCWGWIKTIYLHLWKNTQFT